METERTRRISLTGTVFADKDRAKLVGGHRWNPSEKCWTYPLDFEVCKALRSAFGVRLEIGPKLRRWASLEKKRLISCKEIGAARDAELVIVSKTNPDINAAMASRPYQRSGAAFMARLKAAGNLDEVGLGKTLTTLAAIVEAGKWRGTHLVIAPKTAIESVWGDEIRHWFANDMENIGLFAMPDGKANRQAMMNQFMASNDPTRILVVNKEMLRVDKKDFCRTCDGWVSEINPVDHDGEYHKVSKRIKKVEWPELFEVEWTSITIDEVHKVLSTGAKSATRKSQTAEGIGMLNFEMDHLRFMITGTPFRGKERNLWGLLNWLDPKRFSSKWRFIDSYFDVQDNGYGKVIGDLRPERIADFNALLDRYFLRRTRMEVKNEMPAKIRQDHWVKLEGRHLAQYSEFLASGYATLENGSVESLGVLSELTRLRQLSYGCWKVNEEGGKQDLMPTSESPKLELLLEMLAERGVTGSKDSDFRLEGGYKYVIATQFKQIVDSVCDELRKRGIATLKITGSVTGKQRADVVRSFNSNPDGPRVLVLNTLAGGESITLDNFCDEMFILDETWIADDQLQLEGRIDNRSQARLVPRTFHYIRTRETVEEGIQMLNQSQEETQRMLLDKRRGVEFAMELIK